jgi:hypothetical protein
VDRLIKPKGLGGNVLLGFFCCFGLGIGIKKVTSKKKFKGLRKKLKGLKKWLKGLRKWLKGLRKKLKGLRKWLKRFNPLSLDTYSLILVFS